MSYIPHDGLSGSRKLCLNKMENVPFLKKSVLSMKIGLYWPTFTKLSSGSKKLAWSCCKRHFGTWC